MRHRSVESKYEMTGHGGTIVSICSCLSFRMIVSRLPLGAASILRLMIGEDGLDVGARVEQVLEANEHR